MTPRARSAALGVVVWVTVIAMGSSLVWFVVSRAGAGVSEQAEVSATAAPATPSGGASTTRGPRPSRSGSPQGAASGGATTDRPSTGTASTPSVTAQQRTWTGPAGAVTVECRGASVSLLGAYPSADGYAVEVKDRGPGRVEVEFEGRGSEEGAETKVRAECAGGAPFFDVEQERD